jgi:adenine/guanine phosphoribosyltransferase-like PRPP-binding protein
VKKVLAAVLALSLVFGLAACVKKVKMTEEDAADTNEQQVKLEQVETMTK